MKPYAAGFIGAGNMGGALAQAACRAVTIHGHYIPMEERTAHLTDAPNV